jgi:hypothetical protein
VTNSTRLPPVPQQQPPIGFDEFGMIFGWTAEEWT